MLLLTTTMCVLVLVELLKAGSPEPLKSVTVFTHKICWHASECDL